MHPRLSFPALCLAIAAACVLPARASDRDHDQARKAVEAGEILPLRAILERVERDAPGQILEVELERKDSRWLYEVKVLRPGGSLVKLKLDARDGTLLENRERESRPRRRSGE
jgi:uncharacterized membrane protein YkoI